MVRPPLSSRAMRLPIRTLLEQKIGWNLHMADMQDELNAELPGQQETTEHFRSQIGAGLRRPGRPRLPDEFLRGVAAVYRQSVRKGSNAPSLAVWEWAKANGRPDDTEEAARGWVNKARKRGFLPPGKPGKVSLDEEES